jgi:predicted ester cyclase
MKLPFWTLFFDIVSDIHSILIRWGLVTIKTIEEKITMLLKENKELARQFLEEAINAGNVSAIPEFMVSGSMFAGAFEWFITNYIKVGFPDFHLTIEGVFGEGESVLIQTTIRATQTGPAMGHPPTGKTFMTTGIYIFKMKNGKITSGQWVFDRMEIAQQLGWIPTPAQA